MDRRKFIKSSSALMSLPLLLQSCYRAGSEFNFPIEVNSAHIRGHQLMDARQDFTKGVNKNCEVLIVGGGVAGMSAAVQINGKKDFLLCELEDRLGGTSAAGNWNGMSFSEGAHYELEYPEYYGEENMSFLESLRLIEFQSWKKTWTFKDSQYIISPRRQSRCYENGEYREDVIPDSFTKQNFVDMVKAFTRDMPLPSRLSPDKVRYLDSMSFDSFLKRELLADEEFIRQMDYHMKDDWGGPCSQVSAFAGIHYFACRPYYRQPVALFSPPGGNDYFIQKMANSCDQKRLLKGSMISEIRFSAKGIEAEVLDFQNKKRYAIFADQAIYAAPKHTLKYICPTLKELFTHKQAPWLVLNVALKEKIKSQSYWQNEMLVKDDSFLGFINNPNYQKSEEGQVLTAYYCLPSESAADLIRAEENKSSITEKTLSYLSDYLQEDVSSKVSKVFIRPMGHAMPIPGPNYLFSDANEEVKDLPITFAGVDNHRLPVFMEAVDSGLQAIKYMNNKQFL